MIEQNGKFASRESARGGHHFQFRLPSKTELLLIGLLLRTTGAPFAGSVVFALVLWAVSGYSASGALMSVGWVTLAVAVGVKFQSWAVVVIYALVWGGCATVFLAPTPLAGSMALGCAIHLNYSLTKCRCATIGCCNFFHCGPFGRGTQMRKVHLARVEILLSMVCAAICIYVMRAGFEHPVLLIFGCVAHGMIRLIAWKLRHARAPSSRHKFLGRLSGLEALIAAVVVETSLRLEIFTQ